MQRNNLSRAAIRRKHHSGGKTAVQKNTIRQPKPSARTTASDSMSEEEARISEARRQNATELDLFGLGLTEVPATLNELSQLRSLNLGGNQLREVPIALVKFKQLQELDLFSNQLGEVPSTLFELRQLQKLDLSENQLRYVPDALGELLQLKELDLQHNQSGKYPPC